MKDFASSEELQSLCITYPNLIIVVHGAPEKKQIDARMVSQRKISYYKTTITKDTKELFTKGSLNISQSLYYEALNYNAGLHRKVCVDEHGNIKNYLSHHTVFGNIHSTSIADIIERDDFKEKYLVPNDEIVVCKDCKYRYMCVNNSDLEKRDGKYYKLATCSLIA